MGKGMRNKIRRMNNNMQKIDLTACPFYKCPKCEKEIFDRVEMIKVVSKLLTGQPFNSYVATEVYRCIGCGYMVCKKGEPLPPIG